MSGLTEDEYSAFLDIIHRDELANIVNQIIKIKKLERKRLNLLQDIQTIKNELKGHWDNYIDGTKVFEELDEFYLVRNQLELLHVIPTERKNHPVAPPLYPPGYAGTTVYKNIGSPSKRKNIGSPSKRRNNKPKQLANDS